MVTNRKPAVSLRIGDPVLIAQAPEDVKNWGPYQFPSIETLPDGRLHATWHLQLDSARAYGAGTGHAYSSDGGRSWKHGEPVPGCMHMTLPNGDSIGISVRPSVETAEVGPLPAPLREYTVYQSRFSYYRPEDIGARFGGFRFFRLAAGSKAWTEETARVEDPGLIRWVAEGVLAMPRFWNMRLAPDGALWGINYGHHMTDGKVDRFGSAQFYRSGDGGRTWRFLGKIPFEVDPADDPLWEKRFGFTEPDIAFLPDGSVFCLLRTTDGNGIAPTYFSRSRDGASWTRPQRFDDRGVWPRLLTLRCGVTLAVYGRTGLFLRATADRDAARWDDRVAVVPPGEYQTDTCSYGDLAATGDGGAVVIHSAFQWPNAAGRPAKAILVRRIEVGKR